MGLFDSWFNYKDAGKIIDANRGRATPALPASAPAYDRAGDTLPKQAVVTEAFRKQGVGGLEAFLSGVNNSMQVGEKAAVGGLASGLARRTGLVNDLSDEQMRKYNNAMYELHPVANLFGTGVGALAAVPEIALSGMSTAGLAAKAGLGRLASYLGGAGAAATKAAPLGVASGAGMTAIAGGLGANALGLGEYNNLKSESGYPDAASEAYAAQNPAYKASQEAYNAALKQKGVLGTDRRSAVAFDQIYTPDGKLAPGVTPEQATAVRRWAEYEAKGLAGQTQDGRRDTSAYAPQLFGVDVSRLAAPAAGGSASPVAAAAQTARSLDDTVADYDKLYAAGLMTTKEYNTAKRNTLFSNLAAQLDTTPDVLDALDRAGALTSGFVRTALGQRLGPPRTPRVPTANDLAYAARMQEFDQVERDLNDPENPLPAQERDALLKANRTERSKFLEGVMLKDPAGLALANQFLNQQVE